MSAKYRDFDRQLMRSIRNIQVARHGNGFFHPDNREDWLDQMTYAMHFGTPEEIYREQVRAKVEAVLEGRPFTPIFWTGEFGAEPVLTLWRV